MKRGRVGLVPTLMTSWHHSFTFPKYITPIPPHAAPNRQLGRGLIAITGETGAGKSLISSAFSLAAGARVRGTDLVGPKGPTARVQLDLELGEVHRTLTQEVSD